MKHDDSESLLDLSYSQDCDKLSSKLIMRDEKVKSQIDTDHIKNEDITTILETILKDDELFASVHKSILEAINFGILTKEKVVKIEEGFLLGFYKGGDDIKYRQMIL